MYKAALMSLNHTCRVGNTPPNVPPKIIHSLLFVPPPPRDRGTTYRFAVRTDGLKSKACVVHDNMNELHKK
jgi:hypothetical protein